MEQRSPAPWLPQKRRQPHCKTQGKSNSSGAYSFPALNLASFRNGTNQIHGSAYVFQDAYLNANQYQNVPNQNLCYPGTTGCTNTITPTRRGNDQLSQTGFVIDGPVFIPKLYNGHDKTFFTLASER